MLSGEPLSIILRDVLYSPGVANHLFSLQPAALRDNSYEGLGHVVCLFLKQGEMLKFHTIW